MNQARSRSPTPHRSGPGRSALGRVRSPSGPELQGPLLAKGGRLGDATLTCLLCFGTATGRGTTIVAHDIKTDTLLHRPQPHLETSLPSAAEVLEYKD